MSEIDQYDYDLPKELIAQQPLTRRSDARLLIVERATGSLRHAHVRDLPHILSRGDRLVLNDTRVLPARLAGYRVATGGRWSGLYLNSDDAGRWRVLSKTRGRLKPGEKVMLQDRHGVDAFPLKMMVQLDDASWAAQPVRRRPVLELLAEAGRTPLPPYIRGGEMTEADEDAYQTVYAENPGAVAAPTAGLHFTSELLTSLSERGIGRSHVTLHVGVGTFRPIAAERLDEHPMHEEWGAIDQKAVEELKSCRAVGGRIVAVGTTCVRVLETAAESGPVRPWQGATNLFIRPPYQFRSVDALMTNFHLPRSTLLVLVSAFAGADLIRRAYQEAITERYRFYSYGDAMLIL